MNWRRNPKYTSARWLEVQDRQEQEERIRNQRKNEALFIERREQFYKAEILDRIIVVLSRARVVGNQTTISELSSVLNVPAAGLGGLLGVQPRAIFKSREEIEDLLTRKAIRGNTRCGELRAILRKELSDFEELAKKIQLEAVLKV